MDDDRLKTRLDEIDQEVRGAFTHALEPQFSPEPSHLYHYTTLDGLVGITSSRKLFLSDMLAADDQSEILYGLSVIRDVLSETPTTLLSKSILGALDQDDLWWGLGQHIFAHAACFCQDSDVLTQWRGFSSGRGAAIGFKFNKIKERADRAEFALMKMIYHREDQLRLTRNIVKSADPTVKAFAAFLEGIPAGKAMEALSKLISLFAERLLMLALMFKHNAFESEREWRILVIQDETLTARDLKSDSTVGNLKFLSRRGIVRPYIELSFAPNVVAEIQLSPGYWPRSTEYAIRRLAKTLGGVSVTASSLPLAHTGF